MGAISTEDCRTKVKYEACSSLRLVLSGSLSSWVDEFTPARGTSICSPRNAWTHCDCTVNGTVEAGLIPSLHHVNSEFITTRFQRLLHGLIDLQYTGKAFATLI